VVHSMVRFTDGSTIAQASPPDMRIPIALGLVWPERLPGVANPCDWTVPTSWDFQPLDPVRFPAVGLAMTAGAAGGTAPAVFNAANEECVAAFLAGNIRFPEIVSTVAQVLERHLDGVDGLHGVEGSVGGQPGATHVVGTELTLEHVLTAENWARTVATDATGSGKAGME